MEHIFNPKEIEKKWYKKWIEEKAFETKNKEEKIPYTIPIPPPNVTGKLHLGHALNLSIQDALIRRKRMQGYDTLWLPGTDHAGIATQAKVEEKLREQGITRHDLGREKFLEEVWKWKHEYAENIHKQWASMGISTDYSKERFTLDDGLSQAVKKVFIELYKKGYIYRGTRIINWDPFYKTALSDIEVVWEKEEIKLYTLKYELEDGTGYIPVATTRPETIFGDVAIAVNPKDTRYQHLINKFAIVPISGRKIPIIADEYPKMEFGTGAVKVTPAHDANDFEIGKRHNLEAINMLNEDATLNELTGEYNGLDRFIAREKIIDEIKTKDLLLNIEKYEKEIGYSERSKSEIETRLSLQWFVKMEELAKKAIEHQHTEDNIEFTPSEMENRYLKWMENIHDWCISRQLWWGHRIPVWYCDDCDLLTVEEEEPKKCCHCSSSNIKQDEDVLDTWFSSGLWAFSTLGWLEDSDDYKRYYSTDALVTAYDILPLWVSRMIFLSLEFTGKKPFKDAIIHGLVLDENGEKMSKSKGNGINPLDLIEEYGADALRFMLLTSNSMGADLRFKKDKLQDALSFGIKLWNASRYILLNIKEGFEYESIDNINLLGSADKWILNRLNKTIKETNEAFEKYDFAKAGSCIRSFFFNDFCDEYIEITKDMKEKEKAISQNILIYVLRETLKLLHPFMPFLTEEIWSKLGFDNGLLMLEEYPVFKEEWNFEKEEQEITELTELISKVRSLRHEAETKTHLPMFIKTNNPSLMEYEKNIRTRCKVNFLSFTEEKKFFGKAITLYIGGTEIYLPYLGLYDVKKEKERLKKELDTWEKELERSKNLLSKESFLEKAKPEIIAKEKEKLATYEEKYEKTLKLLKELEE